MKSRRQALKLCLDTAVVVVIEILNAFMLEVFHGFEILQRWPYAGRQAKKYQRLAAHSLDEESRRRYAARSDEWEALQEQAKPKSDYPETVVSREIDTPSYRRKLDGLGEETKVTRAIWQRSVEMLRHRSGTKFEDLAFIDSRTGKSLAQNSYHHEREVIPAKAMKQMLLDRKPYSVIAIHNHPSGA